MTSPNQAAIDTVLNIILGIEANDRAAIAVTLHGDFTFDQSQTSLISGVAAPAAVNGKEAVLDFLMATVCRLDKICHVNTIRSENRASGEVVVRCRAATHHYRPGEALMPDKGAFVVGVEYTSEVLQEESGAWRLRSFVVRPLWCIGDVNIVGGSLK